MANLFYFSGFVFLLVFFGTFQNAQGTKDTKVSVVTSDMRTGVDALDKPLLYVEEENKGLKLEFEKVPYGENIDKVMIECLTLNTISGSKFDKLCSLHKDSAYSACKLIVSTFKKCLEEGGGNSCFSLELKPVPDVYAQWLQTSGFQYQPIVEPTFLSSLFSYFTYVTKQGSCKDRYYKELELIQKAIDEGLEKKNTSTLNSKYYEHNMDQAFFRKIVEQTVKSDKSKELLNMIASDEIANHRPLNAMFQKYKEELDKIEADKKGELFIALHTASVKEDENQSEAVQDIKSDTLTPPQAINDGTLTDEKIVQKLAQIKQMVYDAVEYTAGNGLIGSLTYVRATKRNSRRFHFLNTLLKVGNKSLTSKQQLQLAAMQSEQNKAMEAFEIKLSALLAELGIPPANADTAIPYIAHYFGDKEVDAPLSNELRMVYVQRASEGMTYQFRNYYEFQRIHLLELGNHKYPNIVDFAVYTSQISVHNLEMSKEALRTKKQMRPPRLAEIRVAVRDLRSLGKKASYAIACALLLPVCIVGFTVVILLTAVVGFVAFLGKLLLVLFKKMGFAFPDKVLGNRGLYSEQV